MSEPALVAASAVILATSITNLLIRFIGDRLTNSSIFHLQRVRSARDAGDVGTALLAIVVGWLTLDSEADKTGLWIPLAAGAVAALLASIFATYAGGRSQSVDVDRNVGPLLIGVLAATATFLAASLWVPQVAGAVAGALTLVVALTASRNNQSARELADIRIIEIDGVSHRVNLGTLSARTKKIVLQQISDAVRTSFNNDVVANDTRIDNHESPAS